MSSHLENGVRDLGKDLEIHKLAIEALKRDLENKNYEKIQLTNEWSAERSNWCLIDKQQNEVITTLAEQLRKLDNEMQMFTKVKRDFNAMKTELIEQTKLFIETKKELLMQRKKNKSLKKKVKDLKAHIVTCNDSLDEIICNGDLLTDK
uniref:Uncharacterized protein n=1 Tax=Erinnyis ello granulovirus TaxID=307444 RepID=A0A288WIH9_9BBAC|nr:hypothetical protein EREL_038 [Erinnyis ello granulovirus]